MVATGVCSAGRLVSLPHGPAYISHDDVRIYEPGGVAHRPGISPRYMRPMAPITSDKRTCGG